MRSTVLTKAFFNHDTLSVARKLLGCVIETRIDGRVSSGMIVEVEGYTADDEASHAYRGEKIRNKSMFLEAGTLYVYRSYGIHACFNVVTEKAGYGSAVLIRAVQPLTGIEAMKRRRRVDDIHLLTNGPGKLTEALGITLSHNGDSLFEPSDIRIKRFKRISPREIVTTTRIGISKAVDHPWRYYIKDNPWVSRRAR